MTVGLLDDADALHALAPEWSALWNTLPAATPFQHPAWLLPWWAAFGTGAPRVATWREHGRLRGVLPAYVLYGHGGAQPLPPKLLPIGAGTTDYLDALGDGAAPMLARLLARAETDGVARCDWIDAPPGSALPAAPPPPGWAAVWTQGNPCPVLRLADIPGPAWRKLRMNRNRADRAGGWTIEDGGASLETLVALHQARWTAAGQPGVLADPAVLRCLRAARPALQAAGLLRLQTLHVGNSPAAAIMALLAPGRLFFYLSGYDAAHAFVSPGTLLAGAMLEHAAAEGRTEAHFLRGREPYKYAWGAIDRPNANGALTRVADPASRVRVHTN